MVQLSLRNYGISIIKALNDKRNKYNYQKLSSIEMSAMGVYKFLQKINLINKFNKKFFNESQWHSRWQPAFEH